MVFNLNDTVIISDDSILKYYYGTNFGRIIAITSYKKYIVRFASGNVELSKEDIRLVTIEDRKYNDNNKIQDKYTNLLLEIECFKSKYFESPIIEAGNIINININ